MSRALVDVILTDHDHAWLRVSRAIEGLTDAEAGPSRGVENALRELPLRGRVAHLYLERARSTDALYRATNRGAPA